MKQILLLTSSGSGNLGDEAARITITQQMAQKGIGTLTAYWGGVLTDLYFGERSARFELAFRSQKDIDMVNQNFSAVIITGGGIIGNSFALSKCGNFDWFIDNLKIPLICLSIGVDHRSVYDTKSINTINKLIARADYFSVRDKMDQTTLKQVAGQEVKVTPDIVLAYKNEGIYKGTKVVMNKDIILTYSAVNTNLDAMAEKYAQIVNAIESKGYSVAVLPFTPTSPDLTFMAALINKLDRPQAIELYSLSYIYEAIKQAKLVIGGRLHANVLAALVGVPFVAINYHPKVGAFCEEVGCNDYWPKAATQLDRAHYGISAKEICPEPIINAVLRSLKEPKIVSINGKVKEITELIHQIIQVYIK